MIALPQLTRKLRSLRTRPPVALSLLLAGWALPVVAQDAPDGLSEARDAARDRDRNMRDLIATLEPVPWRQLADLLVEVTPHEDGSASLEVAEVPRPRLLHLPTPARETSAAPESTPAWRLPDGSRWFFRVDFLGRVQEVACTVPEALRRQPVTLGFFRVFETEVACFVRPAS